MNANVLAVSQVVVKNPIRKESRELRELYRNRLWEYIRRGNMSRNQYVMAQWKIYEDLLGKDSEESGKEHDLSFYPIYILVDLIQLLGYNARTLSSKKMDKMLTRYYQDFPEMLSRQKLVTNILQIAQTGDSDGKRTIGRGLSAGEKEYMKLMEKNVRFMKEKPFCVMVTATMSAGKSTFINALTGKYISLAQNMACTSKIHTIVGKPYEDGMVYEYDHDLVMDAGRGELLDDNEENETDNIVVSTYYNGALGGKRIVIKDSPGVNFSGDSEHRHITDRLLKARKYDMLVYVMNATQLATNDEYEHLEYVREHIGRTPILFVVNKIDCINIEEEDVFEIVEKQRKYLKNMGFRNPIICPISSMAAYMSRQFARSELKELEQWELYTLISKFNQMQLPRYYKEHMPFIHVRNAENAVEQLQKTSGFSYVEKIIKYFSEGGKANGTGLR